MLVMVSIVRHGVVCDLSPAIVSYAHINHGYKGCIYKIWMFKKAFKCIWLISNGLGRQNQSSMLQVFKIWFNLIFYFMFITVCLVCMYACLSVCLSVCMSVCLYVCVPWACLELMEAEDIGSQKRVSDSLRME